MKKIINRILGSFGYQCHKIHDTEAVIKNLFRDLQVSQVVDIGANRGDTIEMWRNCFPSANIVGFEPVQDNFEPLSSRFRADRNISIRKLAAGARNKQDKINLSTGGATHSFMERGDKALYGPPKPVAGTTEEVEMVTLDAWAKEHIGGQIALCKIDAEGSEMAVLEGADDLLAKQSIDVVMIELMFLSIYEGQGLYFDIAKRLSIHGYDLYDIPYIRRHPNGQIRWADAIFISQGFRDEHPTVR